VLVAGDWYRGTLLSCEVSEDELTCSGLVCFIDSDVVRTARFPATSMMSPAGIPGCPADHEDQTCSATAMRGV
jgi:hypothetical protein